MRIFRDKEREANLERQITRLNKMVEELDNQLKKAQKENRALKETKEDEYLENCKQHKTIVEIRKIVSRPAGTIKQLIDIVHKIKDLVKEQD